MSYRPDLHTTYWRKVVRPFILARDVWCPGVPAGFHKGELVRATAVDHIDPNYVLTGNLMVDRDHLRGLCALCNSHKAVAFEGAWRFAR